VTTKAGAARRFLDRTPPDIERVRTLLQEMSEAGFRANQVLESVRVLFLASEHLDQPIDVNELAIETLQVLRVELENHGIATDTRLTPALPLVTGHRGQLQEVILNLLQNAIDAVATAMNGSRILKVTTERHGREAIAISVEDSGVGIEPKNMATIFDAFVTTKPKGMGLGLTISQLIVERHGGELSASSEMGRGARFQISLPVKIRGVAQADTQ
jgi:signal transduction histidine kinase